MYDGCTFSNSFLSLLIEHPKPAARKPSDVAIDGLALDGGLEVAMACNARLSTPTTQLGLPKLQLGIIPGFGGTQRLPRLVGLTKGLEMILVYYIFEVVPGVTDCGLVPRQVKKLAIIGGGLMGSGIATALILSNYTVILNEVNEKFLDVGMNRIKGNLQNCVKKGKLTKENFEKTISLIKGMNNVFHKQYFKLTCINHSLPYVKLLVSFPLPTFIFLASLLVSFEADKEQLG
ncbi:hypothetical protein GYH30_052487 [Glycine max]|uniref:3-hydroxyacyl-CoA dehydrogenase NAD binding domain-containing protein n=1 Tax=Glycine max TaxID=3847 RepID=A0A0R0EJZ5_SOYBN|nr:hypothetical protein GYH30_052487 [Glycine max]